MFVITGVRALLRAPTKDGLWSPLPNDRLLRRWH